MIPFEEALRIVLDSAEPLGAERVPLTRAEGRILTEDVAADVDIPPFDSAVFDGYACRRSDLAHHLKVVETIRAGMPPKKTIGPNQCAKIMTGAAVPQGADCVIMIEQTENLDDNVVRFTGGTTADNIRRKGKDVKAGRVVLRSGSRIRPQHIAVLASVGKVRPLVSRQPQVAVVATGDELVEPSAKPGPSQIRNSNASQLVAHLDAVGAVVTDYGVVRDSADEIDRAVKTALAANDVAVFSGGVSVGDFDLVGDLLKRNNVRLLFEKIAVKPGKPTLFGLSERGYCFGLPGNPVSTFVTFELLVKPFLYKLMGHDYSPISAPMVLKKPVTRKDTDRQGWIPVRVTGRDTVEPVEYHGSAHILALCSADGLISMEIGLSTIEKGTQVYVRYI
jgi:molybdopterin molybdotransferase